MRTPPLPYRLPCDEEYQDIPEGDEEEIPDISRGGEPTAVRGGDKDDVDNPKST
jgi:hypothetical protein